ncbi:hypothetical protein V2J09_020253 [Rumex salicifolius]
MFSSILLRERSRIFHNLLSSRVSVRSMGGGPRTFPGGLNKWQWKRLHEKKARDKEKRLLDEEKQLYQARLRSQIRAKLVPGAAHSDVLDPSSAGGSHHGPMSPKDHIKALADRFMKDGAEDLWNEDDGPISSSQAQRPSPMDTIEDPTVKWRNLVEGGGEVKALGSFNSISLPSNLQQRREYSASAGGRVMAKGKPHRWRNNSSSSDDDEDYVRDVGAKWPRFNPAGDREVEDGGQKEERERRRNERSMKKFMSSAALGKHDVITKRRSIMKDLEKGKEFDEEEGDPQAKIEAIKRELLERKIAAKAAENEVEAQSIFSEKRFEDYGISPLTIKALTAAGYVQMTRVQEATIPVYLEGKDALVKARAGTGKSAAFLVPMIEEVIKAMAKDVAKRVPPIYALIICPTRELASQIYAETRVLLRYHDGLGVQTLIGGTRFKDDLKRLELDPCQIVVATPGRLMDHVESKSAFSVRLTGLKVLILDEADQLLDLGFRKDIERIVDCLPRRRQTLLFSATIPKEVRRISQMVLKREHSLIDAVGSGCLETNSKVKQLYIVAPLEQQFHVVHEILREHISQTPDYKVIVFNATGMVTSLMYMLFREMQLNVRELHSRKPQLYRSRISEEFKQSKRIILISSDVSARGMNYPDVTLVLQVGIPPDREQYIHRLGRTGREGKDGQGVLLIAPWEEYFLDDVKDLPIESASSPHIDPAMKAKMDNSMEKIDTSIKEAAYHAWLGYYNSVREIGRNKTELVDLANLFCQSIGLEKPPALYRKTALKMGLKDIPGIRVRKNDDAHSGCSSSLCSVCGRLHPVLLKILLQINHVTWKLNAPEQLFKIIIHFH